MAVAQLTDLENDLAAVRSPKTPAAADDLAADLETVRGPTAPPSPWDDLRAQMRTAPSGTTGNPTLDDALRREAPNGELDAIHRASALTAPPTFKPPTPPQPSLFEPAPLPPGYATATRGRYTGLPVPTDVAHGPSSALRDPVSEGLTQLVRGVTAATPALPSGALTRPHGDNVPLGDLTAPTPQLLNAGSDLIEGAMKLATPVAIAGAILDLPAAAGAYALSWLAGKAAGKAVEVAGGTPELQRFTSNIAAAATALGGAKVVYERIQALPDVAQAAARPFILAGKLNAPGFGTGEVPGYRPVPATEETGAAAPLGRQAESGRPVAVPPEVSTAGTTFESPDVTAETQLPSGARIVPTEARPADAGAAPVEAPTPLAADLADVREPDVRAPATPEQPDHLPVPEQASPAVRPAVATAAAQGDTETAATAAPIGPSTPEDVDQLEQDIRDAGVTEHEGRAPAPTPDRAGLLDRIVEAVRADIVARQGKVEPSYSLKGTDGKYYPGNGFPQGVDMVQPVDRKLEGYSLVMPDGTRAGQITKTAEEQQAKQDARLKADLADMRAHLEAAPDARLASQARHWLKDQAEPLLDAAGIKVPLPAQDLNAVRRAWSNLERPPSVDVALASAVPPGQDDAFYRGLASTYGVFGDRAERRAKRSKLAADTGRWQRIAADWRKAEAAAKLHFENATSETAPPAELSGNGQKQAEGPVTAAETSVPAAPRVALTDAQRAQGDTDLKRLEKRYRFQSTRLQRDVAAAETPEQLAQALEAVQAEGERLKGENDTKETARRQRVDATRQKYLDQGRHLAAAGKPIVWRVLNTEGEKLWRPMEGKLVDVPLPNAPADVTFGMFREDVPGAGKGWRLVEQSTGMTLDQALSHPTQKAAIESAIAAAKDVTAERWTTVLERGRKDLPPKPDLTAAAPQNEEAKPEVEPTRLKGGDRVTADEGTGTVYQVRDGNVKIALEPDGHLSMWIPAARVTPATEGKEAPHGETVGEARDEDGGTSSRPEAAPPKNPEATALRALDVLLGALRDDPTAPFPKHAAEFRTWLARAMHVPPATLAADVDQINDAVEAALAETLARFAAAHAGAWDAQFAEAERLEQLLPKAHRTLEKTKLQQFSTPLTISVRAGQAAAVQPTDRVLEPTAGTGNLLVSVSPDVPVTAVELSARRADLLRAEHYNVQQGDYLGAKVSKASVIISNPPWGKYSTGKYGKAVGLGFTPVDVAERFLGKMYRDLEDGGRLVAVMPTTMLNSPSFKSWLRANGTVRAIIQSPPGAYDTRATGVDSLLLVYDKTKPAGVFSTELPATVVAANWQAYAQAVEEVPARESTTKRDVQRQDGGVGRRPAGQRPAGEAPRPAPRGEPGRLPEGRPGAPERGRHLDVPAGRDAGVVADQRGPEAARGPDAVGPGIVEQPVRATADALRTAEGEFADVIDHSAREARAARGSREFAPYVRRTQLRGVGHPKLVVEARQLAGVQYPPLTLEAGPAITTALREKRVSVEQAEQALAAVQANVVGHHGYLAADNVGVGKSREIALVILDLMERAKAAGRDLRLVVTTKSGTNIRDLLDNELYYVATGRTKDGLDLLNVDAPKVAPPGLPFEVVETHAWPDAKRTGTEYKPMPTHRHAIYVTDFANLASFRQGLVDVTPHGIVGDEAHSFKNVEGAAVGGAWQNLHAEIIRGVPRDEQVFAYFTATPAQTVNDYQYLYGLRLWPLDGFAQWANLATGGGDEKDAAALEEAVEKGAFNMDRVVGNTAGDVVGGDAEDTGGRKPSKFAAASYSDIFTSKLTPAEAEQIPREWKMLGRFSSRDLWRDGQEFRIHEAKLPAKHAATYDRFVDLSQAIAKAAYSFGLLDASGKRSRFGVTGQLQFAAKRIQMQPALEEALTVARRFVDDGYQVVLSVINVTDMDPQKGNIAAAIQKINDRLVQKDPDDPDGGFVDGGEIPEAMVAKAELLERAADLGTFDDPVTMVEDAFGRDQVAFITGDDTTTARRAAMKAFQEGKRPVAFLSSAGATGINLDHRVLTEQGPGHGRRVFIDVQFEWSATQAIQRYGRVGRAASVTQPVLMPLTFGNASEKKFLATIANRMASLGALSKGGAETTGASGLEEFEITGPVAAEAARQAYNALGEDARRYFAVVKSVFRSPNRTKDDPFEPISRAPTDATMKDVQLALLFTPMAVSNTFWSTFVRVREALNEKVGATSSRTEAMTGEILRQTELGTPDKPLTLSEVKNAKGERFGVLSGLITPRMPILRQFLYHEDGEGHRTFARKYVTFTAGDQVASGLRIPWGKVHALAETFEIDLGREKLDTPAKVFAALRAGENLELQQTTDTGQRWTIGLRRDGKIAIGHAKMADRTLLLNNGGGYAPVGHFWFTTEEKLPKFLERFPLYEAPLKAPPTKGGGSRSVTAQSTLVPGGQEFVEQDIVPALKTAADTFVRAAAQLRRQVAPATVTTGVQAAGVLRAMMAEDAQLQQQMMRASTAFHTAFDALLKTPHGQDLAVDWWDAVQTGQPTQILPALKPAYDYMRGALDEERSRVQTVGKLEEFNEFYFPQIWKFPRAEAAFAQRLLGGLLGKRPFEGSKSFLKQRKYPTFREGLKALQPKGIEPISYNPVDHFRIKMREMARYRVARQAIAAFTEQGIWKLYTGARPPEGWTRIEGALGTLYGPPQIGMKEAFDPLLFEGLERFARSLGVTLTRKVNIGGRRWGYAEGDRAITTKAAGPEGVLMHEIGHILDERYGLRGMVKDKKFRQELRDLADLRHEGIADVPPGRRRYERKGEEKIANLVHAFLYAPERAKKVAPNAYWALYNLAKKTKTLRPLLALQKTRSVRLGTRTHAIDLGGFPELGHYAMPDDAARVFNNHLSQGLAGRSAIYDAYRWLNNSMVMGQLAFSGLRHLTFTGINALVSEGALALQEATRAVQTKDWTLLERAATRAATVTASGVVGGAAGFAIGGPVGVLWASGYPLAAAKFIKGWRAQQAWLKEDPGYRQFGSDVRRMIEGGFRPVWDDIYHTSALSNALRAVKQGNYPGALARLVPATIDLVATPVMQFAVPGVKTAAYLDLAAFELERLQTEVHAVEDAEAALNELPTGKARTHLTKEQRAVIAGLEAQKADNLAVIREALNKVQASIDNRFGEVVYDNWFWKRWLKDLTHIVFRAPGWQAGTYKELLGALPAQVSQLRRVASGGGGDGQTPDQGRGAGAAPEPPSSTSARTDLLAIPMAYTLTLVGVLMIINGMAHYLATGEKPHGKDWMYPKGPDGKRRAPPTYMSTFLSAWRHPLGAAVNTSAPLNSALYRTLVSNETYSGEIIRDPSDPFLVQAWDALRLVGREGYQPFLFENMARGQRGLESTMGVSPAPAEVNRSAAQNYLHEAMPPQTRTHEQQAKLEDRRALRDALTTKDGAGVGAAIQAGALSKATVRDTVRRDARPAIVNQFENATLTQALHAYALATPEERFALRPYLYKKYGTLIKTTPAAERPTIIGQFNAARTLPVGTSAPPVGRQ